MKKACMMIFCLMLIGLASVTFAKPFLVCDPQATGVDNYKVEIRDASDQLVANPDVAPDPTGEYGFRLDLALLGLPDGSYTVTAVALNSWGESEPSLPFVFTKSGPSVPTGMSIVQD